MYYARIMFMQHIVHAEAACALYTLTDTTGHMIHHEAYVYHFHSFSINKHSVSLHPLRHLRMLLALFQAMLQYIEDVVECLSKCVPVLCLRISNHLQLNNPEDPKTP